MDDMVDLGRDTRRARHNYVAALIYHGSVRGLWEQLQEKAAAEPEEQDRATLLLDFPGGIGAVRAPGTALSVRRPESFV